MDPVQAPFVMFKMIIKKLIPTISDGLTTKGTELLNRLKRIFTVY